MLRDGCAEVSPFFATQGRLPARPEARQSLLTLGDELIDGTEAAVMFNACAVLRELVLKTCRVRSDVTQPSPIDGRPCASKGWCRPF
ncbi:hypothetical protein [uncultured Thiodictyon sp.]|uniref:hypothetical protein n=1 Tax=uncultured Thiodictyon sp. TaxID=1846217 RepID=UPI0025EE83A4|nr:hypothetical protein [uncultured Thiodictyon sp.]